MTLFLAHMSPVCLWASVNQLKRPVWTAGAGTLLAPLRRGRGHTQIQAQMLLDHGDLNRQVERCF